MKSKASHEGYLLIDNRAAGGSLFEGATITCCHCQATWYKNPLRTRPRAYCARCDAYVCDSAACQAACTPFWKQVDEELTRITNGKGADHG